MQTLQMDVPGLFSALAVGVGLNLAVSYLSVFTNPLIRRLDARCERVKEIVAGVKGTSLRSSWNVEEIEGELNDARFALWRLRRAVDEYTKPYAVVCVASALLCFLLLVFGDLIVGIPAWLARSLAVLLSLGPVAIGSTAVWWKTRHLRAEAKARAVAAETAIDV